MAEDIGSLLIRIGAMRRWQVDDVLRAQKGGDPRLFGEIAIEFGYIDEQAVKRYVDYVAQRTEGTGGIESAQTESRRRENPGKDSRETD